MMNEDRKDIQRGADALAELRKRGTVPAPAGLLQRIVSDIRGSESASSRYRGFWTGTAFGSALAASVFLFLLAAGWLAPGREPGAGPQVFQLAQNETRNIDLAIETDHALSGATISIFLSGTVAVDGYGERRELTWSDDLEAGINRLSLPLIATGTGPGQLLVRLSHPRIEQIYVVSLQVET